MDIAFHSKKQLKADLSALGICTGDALLIHSSYKSLGGIEGGAAGFFETVVDLLGINGTLVIPTLSFRDVTYDHPFFDARTTPSCVGYLTEYFRTQFPGAIRSFHATHSCTVFGKNADIFVKDHIQDTTPVGTNSPFTKLPLAGGKILMLGCGNRSITSMHGVEESAEPPYLFDRTNPIRYTLTDKNGNITEQVALRHAFHRKDVSHIQRYDRLPPLLEEGEIWYGKVLDADCTLMSAPAVWKKGRDMLVKDPYFFVDVLPVNP